MIDRDTLANHSSPPPPTLAPPQICRCERRQAMTSSQLGSVSTTASTCTADTARGRHTFKISGYSLHKGLGAGKYIRSATFNVGGHGWSVRYYPDGHTDESTKDFVCVYLELMAEKGGGGGAAAVVRAVYDLRLVDQLTGNPRSSSRC